MNVLAVILARAGSMGLKNKHLLSLLGRPVIAYTFDHARAALRLTHTVVSSDCPQILALARATGLDVIQRPEHLATADASVQDVLLHAMQSVESTSTFHADAIVTLYGNVPVRGDGVIDRAIDMLDSTGCDSVRSFCPVGKWHPGWMARIEDDARVTPLRKGSVHRRQDLEPLHLHDGAVVAVSRKSLSRGFDHPDDPHAFFGVDRRAILTGPGETVEIDAPVDFFLAEAILRGRQSEIRKAS
jgi:CMP-N,N'-diacetyllegionaminic acid synthase